MNHTDAKVHGLVTARLHAFKQVETLELWHAGNDNVSVLSMLPKLRRLSLINSSHLSSTALCNVVRLNGCSTTLGLCGMRVDARACAV